MEALLKTAEWLPHPQKVRLHEWTRPRTAAERGSRSRAGVPGAVSAMFRASGPCIVIPVYTLPESYDSGHIP